MGNARPIDGRQQSEVQVGPDKLEVVAFFCYLGDMLSAGGGCEMAVTTHVKTAWKKLRELLPVLTSRHLSYKGAQWLSGRVLDSRPKGRGFEPHRCHCVVVLEQDIYPSFVLVQPRKTCLA